MKFQYQATQNASGDWVVNSADGKIEYPFYNQGQAEIAATFLNSGYLVETYFEGIQK